MHEFLGFFRDTGDHWGGEVRLIPPVVNKKMRFSQNTCLKLPAFTSFLVEVKHNIDQHDEIVFWFMS